MECAEALYAAERRYERTDSGSLYPRYSFEPDSGLGGRFPSDDCAGTHTRPPGTGSCSRAGAHDYVLPLWRNVRSAGINETGVRNWAHVVLFRPADSERRLRHRVV